MSTLPQWWLMQIEIRHIHVLKVFFSVNILYIVVFIESDRKIEKNYKTIEQYETMRNNSNK